jgi:hypothetical protein
MGAVADFSEILRRAIADLEEHGFDSQERVERWVNELGNAAGNQGIVTADKLKERFQAIYAQEVTKGALLRTQGVKRWQLSRLEPKLRAELDRKLMAASSLIKLNREEMIARTIRRFQGWATSIPVGGSDAIDKPEVKAHMKQALKSLPFEERRVMIDQGAKFRAGLSNIVAVENGAVGGVWRSHYRAPGYNYREDHKERDGHFYLIRGSWAIEKGLINPKGATFTDEITMPAEEIFCQCRYKYIYNLRDVPDELLTKKGREALGKD